MIHEGTVDDFDVRAMQLSQDAHAAQFAMFTLRALPSGDVRLIGPGLSRDLIVKMLRGCADKLESGGFLAHTMN